MLAHGLAAGQLNTEGREMRVGGGGWGRSYDRPNTSFI